MSTESNASAIIGAYETWWRTVASGSSPNHPSHVVLAAITAIRVAIGAPPGTDGPTLPERFLARQIKAGQSRMAKMSPEERAEFGRKASLARWGKK